MRLQMIYQILYRRKYKVVLEIIKPLAITKHVLLLQNGSRLKSVHEKECKIEISFYCNT